VSTEKFITSLPFIAIRSDFDGDRIEKTEGEYVVNPLPVDITDVTIRTGGFYSDDDGVVEGKAPVDTLKVVKALSAERFTLSTVDEYDEFVCWWHLKYTVGGRQYSAEFSTGKSLRGARFMEDLPFLEHGVRVVPREKCDDLELLDRS
jgi:hypothetical protein